MSNHLGLVQIPITQTISAEFLLNCLKVLNVLKVLMPMPEPQHKEALSTDRTYCEDVNEFSDPVAILQSFVLLNSLLKIKKSDFFYKHIV